MKHLLIIPLFLMIFAIISCEEDIREPLLNDGIKPSPVSNVQIENLPGGALLSYTLPKDDDDLLYVYAEYQLNSGKPASAKASIYNNSLRILGFGDTSPKKVALYTVDRGENKSDPIEVTVNPLEAPVTTISNTVKIVADFGGAHFFWENASESEVAFLIFTKDSIGNLEQVDIKYSSALEDDFAVRGYNTDSREFVVLIRDRYDNFSDSVKGTVEPLFEELLDKNNFRGISLPHDTPDAWGWVPSNLFNFSIDGSGFHTPQGWTDPEPLPEYPDGAHITTWDLGVTAKLSRWKFWQRQGDWAFRHGNPRYFEVWGTKELPTSGTFEGWTKLIANGEVVKPSGLPAGQLTNEDSEQAANGEEFTFPLDADPVRYIRFVSIESWSGARFMHFMEVDFWGDVQE